MQVTFPEGVTLSPTTEEKGTGEHRLGQEKGPWGRGLTEPEGPQVLWHRPRVHTPFLGGLRKEADAHLKLWPRDLIAQSQHHPAGAAGRPHGRPQPSTTEHRTGGTTATGQQAQQCPRDTRAAVGMAGLTPTAP